MLIHTGRTSGREYETPLDAHPVEGGYVFILVYGPRSDWVQNVLAAGTARLRSDGGVVELVEPRLISEDEAWSVLGDQVQRPPAMLNVTDYLRMDAPSPAGG